jgi:hypothetical protein
MFWKIFAALSLILASYFSYSYLDLAKKPSAIETSQWVEKGYGGKWYRFCKIDGYPRTVQCEPWAKATTK